MRPILPILGILSALWLLGGTWWLSNLVCGASASQTMSVTDGEFRTQAKELFSFQQSSYKPAISSNTEGSLKDVVKHMTDNPDRLLTLSGVFGTQETNDGTHDNLGIARAESIKSLLVSYGADPDQITITSERIDNLSFIDNKLYSGVNFIFDGKPTPPETLSSTSTSETTTDGSSGNLQPLTLMFENAEVDYEATSDLNEYIAYLKNYLDNNSGATVMVTGHTDKGGSQDEMKKISSERAKKVRRILRNAGLKSEEVKYSGKGYEEPIVSHDNSDAVVQNNRVVISIQN